MKLSPYCHSEYLVYLRDFTFNLSDVSLHTYTMLYLSSDWTVFSFVMSPRNDRNKRNRSNDMLQQNSNLHAKSKTSELLRVVPMAAA